MFGGRNELVNKESQESLANIEKTYTFAPVLLQQVLGVVLNEAAATQLPVSRVSC